MKYKAAQIAKDAKLEPVKPFVEKVLNLYYDVKTDKGILKAVEVPFKIDQIQEDTSGALIVALYGPNKYGIYTSPHFYFLPDKDHYTLSDNVASPDKYQIVGMDQPGAQLMWKLAKAFKSDTQITPNTLIQGAPTPIAGKAFQPTKPQQESLNQLDEEEIKSVDQVLDTPKTQEISKKLSQDPALLQKSIDQLSKLGIDKNTLMKAAQAHSSGKDVGSIIDDKVETAVEKVNEASGFTDAGKMLTGLSAGLTGLSLVGGLPVLAGAVILALIGAGAAVVGSKIDYKQQRPQAESLDNLDEVVDKVLAKLRSTK